MEEFELRAQARMAMRGVPERLGLRFADGQIEMRSKPSGHGTTNFEWNGYATVYGADFDMWDQNGDPFTESVAPGAAKRSLANPALVVPFLVGQSNDAGISAGAYQERHHEAVPEDTQGVHSHVPAMDGRREEVRALASAVERGDLDEMSLAFVCLRQAWDDAYERRTIMEMDLHRGDVCAVTHGANPATAGASMRAVEQLAYRRPASIGGPVLLGHERLSATQAERDKAHAAGNSLPDKSYPINNVAQLHSAAVLAASHHGDWQAAQALIRRRAKELGVDVTTLPGFGEDHADGRPYELRASAGDSIDIANAPDYNPSYVSDVPCPECAASNDADANYCDQCGKSMGTSATVTVDDTTGIPSEEYQFSDGQQREWRVRMLELEELACAR